MTWVRVIGCIGLMLSTSTVSATLRPAGAPDDTAAPSSAIPAEQPARNSDSSDKEPSSNESMAAMPAMDVWDGNLARTSADHAHMCRPVPSAACLAVAAARPFSACPFGASTGGQDHDPSPGRWLICRYAHAPPVSA